ncbi:mitochondrial chaperone Frataxin like protein [Zymoseptoria brevis]|uniref:ferroxidase n=1 Tax=Zymoseptoria brevis TaxID=1047168 RepID=A0A0F4GV92_9PEZI|nr:mitochondrial chaperone Frataxin like protein [Zymoseptoria brevis]
MSAPAASRMLQRTMRNATRGFFQAPRTRQMQTAARPFAQLQTSSTRMRMISTSNASKAGLMPDSEDPEPPAVKATEAPPAQPTELSDEAYATVAEEYMELVHEKAEQIQETREDVEVEYSAGVLSITFPPAGTYIINKQPPNKQIWLSSPISGPKRYDWVIEGEGMHQKEGGGTGEWVYLRDGTNLTELLGEELGIHIYAQAGEEMKGSTDPTE